MHCWREHVICEEQTGFPLHGTDNLALYRYATNASRARAGGQVQTPATSEAPRRCGRAHGAGFCAAGCRPARGFFLGGFDDAARQDRCLDHFLRECAARPRSFAAACRI